MAQPVKERHFVEGLAYDWIDPESEWEWEPSDMPEGHGNDRAHCYVYATRKSARKRENGVRITLYFPN